jgi:hypothetical protein
VALVRRKVWKGADENDHSQTHVIALQIRKVVDKYLSKNPKLARDWSIQNSHIHIASAIVVEAVYEIQMHREKIFSKYLLNDDVEKVDVDSVYIRRQHESDGEFWIRTLEYTIDRLYANDKKLAIENRGLKSENEVIPNLRFQRDLAKSAEQAALQKVEKASACNVKLTAELRDERAKRDDDRTKFQSKLDHVGKEMSGLQLKTTKFELEAILSKRKVTAAEQQAVEEQAGRERAEQRVEELLQELKGLRLTQY